MSDDDKITPSERHEATLDEHRPYVMCLFNAVSALDEVARRLSELLHEFRIARDPIGERTRLAVADTGQALEAVGKSIKETFA